MTLTVPWNASWSGEMRYEVRPCRWVGGRLALWQPHASGEGRPIFAKPHQVRQRMSIARGLCTVCGEQTPEEDRWWFGHGHFQEGWFMTVEAPVHRVCAELALSLCPHLRGKESDLAPFPGGSRVLASIVGGPATDTDFGVRINGRKVCGHLKLAWPESMIRYRRSASA